MAREAHPIPSVRILTPTDAHAAPLARSEGILRVCAHSKVSRGEARARKIRRHPQRAGTGARGATIQCLLNQPIIQGKV
eukprot:scaffold1940_cov312-Prasinococcus_capsulatus_cf.AAC.1